MKEAIAFLAKKSVESLDEEYRKNTIINTYYIGDDDLLYLDLEDGEDMILVEDDARLDEVIYTNQKRIDSYLSMATGWKLHTYKQSYLEFLLKVKSNKVYQITDYENCCAPCVCCHYRTLSIVGIDDICSVCHWQDDGVPFDCLDTLSGANGATLREAQRLFKEMNVENCPQDLYERATSLEVVRRLRKEWTYISKEKGFL